MQANRFLYAVAKVYTSIEPRIGLSLRALPFFRFGSWMRTSGGLYEWLCPRCPEGQSLWGLCWSSDFLDVAGI